MYFANFLESVKLQSGAGCGCVKCAFSRTEQFIEQCIITRLMTRSNFHHQWAFKLNEHTFIFI